VSRCGKYIPTAPYAQVKYNKNQLFSYSTDNFNLSQGGVLGDLKI